MSGSLRRLVKLLSEDRGSGAGAAVIFALVVLVLAAFVVDGGLSIHQRERAADIAEQAARYAAMDIDEEALRDDRGQGAAPIDYRNCPDRVAAFARQAGLAVADVAASRCTTATRQRVTVRIRLTYRPIMLGLFYSGPIRVYGTASAVNRTG